MFIYTHEEVINYNCLKDSKQLLNETASEKKKKKNNNNNKNKYKRNERPLINYSFMFFFQR